MDARVVDIETRAFDAWPAEEVQALGGWRLRATRGVTNRANSVWPGGGDGPADLEERLARTESFYAERGLPTRFQVSPVAAPPELDAHLDARGYTRYAPVSVQIAAAEAVAQPSGVQRGDRVRVSVADDLDEDWFEVSGRRGRFEGAATDVYRDLLARLRGRAGFALGRLHGRAGFALARRAAEPLGVGLGVVDGSWAGVFAMLTLPAARRSGVGAAVLVGLARWARERGADQLYLQVEENNEAAQALYRQAGFATCYGYHYRRAPS